MLSKCQRICTFFTNIFQVKEKLVTTGLHARGLSHQPKFTGALKKQHMENKIIRKINERAKANKFHLQSNTQVSLCEVCYKCIIHSVQCNAEIFLLIYAVTL